MQHVYTQLPDRLSPTQARRIAVEIEGVVNRHTGALVDATVTDLAPFTLQERRTLRAAIDLALEAMSAYGGRTTAEPAAIVELRDRIDPDARSAIVAAALQETQSELTRPQELAADAMAAQYGRSRVRHLSDGAVVIVGLTDDVERASVCINQDGTERWRG